MQSILALVLLFSAAVLAEEEVRIGVILPLTGAAASTGVELRNAAELAAEIVNTPHKDLALPLASGAGLPHLKGAKVKLVFADHQGNPQLGASEAERLITVHSPAATARTYGSRASGLRVSEVVSLPRDRVDVESGILRVTGKGGRKRLVPFGKSAGKWLALYLSQVRPGLDRRGSSSLFLTPRGSAMTRQRFWQLIQGYGRSAGIRSRLTPHRLRHSFATHMFDDGAELPVIQTLLGHADPRDTMIYVHLSTRRLRSAPNPLDTLEPPRQSAPEPTAE